MPLHNKKQEKHTTSKEVGEAPPAAKLTLRYGTNTTNITTCTQLHTTPPTHTDPQYGNITSTKSLTCTHYTTNPH